MNIKVFTYIFMIAIPDSWNTRSSGFLLLRLALHLCGEKSAME